MANVTPTSRHVVPRWRTFADAVNTGELNPSEVRKQPAIGGEEFLKDKETDWLTNGTLLFATDLISAAHVLGASDVAKKAAEFVLENRRQTSPLACRLAASLLGVPEVSTVQQSQDVAPLTAAQAAVRQLKLRRIREPRNAFVWMDLARLYSVLGLTTQAAQALRIALALAPFDRFIIRSAARFYLHVGDRLQALELIRKNDRTPRDPWLLAGEIAVSEVAGKTPRFAKVAEDMIKRGAIAPFHLSEVRAALGSLKLSDGNSRSAKRLFSQIEDPTDNALAQAVWWAPKIGLSEFESGALADASSYASEARALEAQNGSKWEASFSQAQNWIRDEGFSARPFVFASAVATPLQNHAAAIQICRDGLNTNPRHAILTNNLAFSLVEDGNPAEAASVLAGVDLQSVDDSSKICFTATHGLVRYRLGDPNQGRTFYELAISLAEKAQDKRLGALARTYLAREEFRIGNPTAKALFEEARVMLEKFGTTREIAISATIGAELKAAETPIQITTAPWLAPNAPSL